MQFLPAALAALAPYRQFTLYDTAPSATRPGRTDKFVVHPQGRYRVNAHDPANWLDAQTAIALAGQLGLGVGFVFTDADPLWFIDIDDCRMPDGTWSPAAQTICSWFPGAAMEVSHSGNGLHIIGTGRPPEPRRVKCGHVFDLYSSGRFVALTGTGATGDAGTDHTAALAWVVANYLQPRPGEENAGDGITDAPCPEWRGPTDDAELLRRAMQSKSARSAFGGHAKFADLWHADADVLAKAYPPDQGGGGYDASKVDMALLQHLAFWTGKHGTRMEVLARQSKLARPKWDERDDYLHNTITKVCAIQGQVLQDKPPEPVAGPQASQTPGQAPEPGAVAGTTFLSPSAQVDLFRGCVYISDMHQVLVPGGELLTPERFRVRFGGYTFAMDMANERTVRNAWEAFTESQALRCPKADGTCFRPDRPPAELMEMGGRIHANAWWPVKIPQVEGDVSLFLAHLAKLLPNPHDQQVLLSYMAACVQHKGIKFQWAPLLQGVEGNGKSFFNECLINAVGERYSHSPRADQISAKFNSWLRNKLVIAVEDVYVPDTRMETIEILKPMITATRLPVELKGVDQVMADVCCNWLLNSNHKGALRKTRNDRRFSHLYCAQQDQPDLARDGLTGAYFRKLIGWYRGGGVAHVNHFLATYPIPEAYNPATGQIAPLTSSTEEAIAESLGVLEQEVIEAIDTGVSGFRGGWVSSMALKTHLAGTRGAKLSGNKRRDLLRSLGYDWHPGLTKGQAHNTVLPDGGKPQLFIRNDHPLRSLVHPSEIARAYTNAQTVA